MAQAQINMCYCHLAKFTVRSSLHTAKAVNYFTFTYRLICRYLESSRLYRCLNKLEVRVQF